MFHHGNLSKLTLLITILLTLSLSTSARADLINFEGLVDGQILTNQFSGVTFANATVLTSGISLNEFEFPPVSGQNVIFDANGPMTILFTQAVSSLSASFTYLSQLTFTVFDTALTPVITRSSLFNQNLALSGDLGSTPNEIQSFSFATGIRSITIQGLLDGGSFTLDDLTYFPLSPVTSVPEPSALALMVIGLALALLLKKSLMTRGVMNNCNQN